MAHNIFYHLSHVGTDGILEGLRIPEIQLQINDVAPVSKSNPIFFYLGIGGKDMEVIQRLIEMGVVIEGEDGRGLTLLHYCALCNLHEVAKFLMLEHHQIETPDSRLHELPIDIAVKKSNWETAGVFDTYSGSLQRLLRERFRSMKTSVSAIKKTYCSYPQGLLLFLNYGEPFAGMDFFVSPPKLIRVESTIGDGGEEDKIQQALVALNQVFSYASEEFLFEHTPWNIMFEDLVDNVDLSWALNDKMRKENRFRFLTPVSSKVVPMNINIHSAMSSLARFSDGVSLFPYERNVFEFYLENIYGSCSLCTCPNRNAVFKLISMFVDPGTLYFIQKGNQNVVFPKIYICHKRDQDTIIIAESSSTTTAKTTAKTTATAILSDASVTSPPQSLVWTIDNLSHSSSLDEQVLAAQFLSCHKGMLCIQPGEIVVLDFDITFWVVPTGFKLVCNIMDGKRPARFVIESAVSEDQGILKTGHAKPSLKRTPFQPIACVWEGSKLDKGLYEFATIEGTKQKESQPAITLRTRERFLVEELQTFLDDMDDDVDNNGDIGREKAKRIEMYMKSCPAPLIKQSLYSSGQRMKVTKHERFATPSCDEYIPRGDDHQGWIAVAISLPEPQRKISQGSRTFRLRSLEEENPIFIRYIDIFSSCRYSTSA
eukprot:m.74862 g.74862  ORF g.74862 m.74862 type:complete len:655 (-) comp8461_c0_seq9:79-2043(-)